MQYRLCVIHAFDPRGSKVGGPETFIRDIIAFLPEDFSFLMIGVDALGDLEIGKVTTVKFRGRMIEFLPVHRFPDGQAREAATSIHPSITFQFMQGLLRHWPAVRRKLGGRPTSVDLQRVEFAPLVRSLGIPFIQTLHGEDATPPKWGSLLKIYRFLHNVNERIAVMAADKFLCFNPIITERIRKTYSRHAHKIDTLSTWVDTKTFFPRPFVDDGAFRVAFAGRLDLFKSPLLMFKTMHRLREKIGTGVEFHYLGTSDPNRFPAFKFIEDMTVLHGFKSSAGVSEVLGNVHAGILTSECEGVPFAVLEALGCGRPFVAIHLPQLERIIKEGLSGKLVPRSDSKDGMADRLSDAFVQLRGDIRAGRITPEGVASAIRDFTPERQVAKHYEFHRQIQRRKFWPGTRSVALAASKSSLTSRSG